MTRFGKGVWQIHHVYKKRSLEKKSFQEKLGITSETTTAVASKSKKVYSNCEELSRYIFKVENALVMSLWILILGHGGIEKKTRRRVGLGKQCYGRPMPRKPGLSNTVPTFTQSAIQCL
jgi:hypothetical protein